MNPINPKLLSLSALATSFLALQPNSADAQFYHDYDPDSLIVTDSTVFIYGYYLHLGEGYVDLNQDGRDDFVIRLRTTTEPGSWGFPGTGDEAQWASVEPLNDNAILHEPSASFVSPLNVCSSVSPYAPSGHTFGTSTLKLAWRWQGGSDAGSTNSNTVGWNTGYSKSLGVRVNFGGQDHYGWIRMRAWAGGARLDATYLNSTPNSSVLAGVYPGDVIPFETMSAEDIGEATPEESIRVKFTTPACLDDSLVSEYRVYIIDSNSITYEELLAFPSSYSVSPAGSVYDFTLPPGTTDAVGNPISNKYYRVWVVSVPISGTNYEYAYSPVVISGVVSPTTNLILQDLGNAMDASDFKLKFDLPASEVGINQYEIFLAHWTVDFTLEMAESSAYKVIAPAGTAFDMHLDASLTAFDGASLVDGSYYVAYVLSRSIGILGYSNILSEKSNSVRLLNAPYPSLPGDDGDDDDTE